MLETQTGHIQHPVHSNAGIKDEEPRMEALANDALEMDQPEH